MTPKVFYISKIRNYVKDLLALDIIVDRDGMGYVTLVNDDNLPIHIAINIKDKKYYSQTFAGGKATTEIGKLAGSGLIDKTNEKTPTYTVENHIIYAQDERNLVVYNTEDKKLKRFPTSKKKVSIYRKADLYHVITE